MSKLIKKISDLIEDQLDSAKDYAKCAVKYKDENPTLAKVMSDISADELHHVSLLHAEVLKAIEAHRKTEGEPPASMLAVYDYLHEKQIEKANEVKHYQALYKGG